MDEKRLEELFNDQKFMDALKAADKAEEVVRLFAENGVEVSTEEAETFLEGRAKGAQSGELNEDELDAVAGGWNWRAAAANFGRGYYDGTHGNAPGRRNFWYGLGYAYAVYRR